VLRKSFSSKLAFTLSFAAGVVLLAQQPAPQDTLDEAAAAFEQGKTAEASQELDAFLKKHPAELRALVLMGAALDRQQRYQEAENYYQRALSVAPNSAQVLNNAANHYLASGNRSRAREFYLKTIAIDPRHPNANLQLAQMSVEDKQGRQALGYLGRLEASTNTDPGVVLLRARALAASGRCPEASELLGKLQEQTNTGPSVYFSTGMAFADCKLYEQAERAFSRALDADPRNFDVLYNLGLAALEAGHSDRAASVLEIALHERPDDADCLYAEAQALLKQKRPVDAAGLLAKGQKLAPGRADILLLLAQVTAQLQFYEDSAAAYDRYLKLRPADEGARRERGFVLALANRSQSGLRDLEWYARKHPRDGIGFYELAIAQCFEQRARAFQSLDRALALDPKLIQARYTRAVLNIEEEKPGAAIDDLRLVLEREPDNFRVLTRLGQAYLGLHRSNEAVEVLKKAVDLAPESTQTLIQYRRALQGVGRNQEAAEILARLKQPGIAPNGPRLQAGLIDYLSLPASDQRARYLANLRKEITGDPTDLRLKIRLGRELLVEGKTAEGLDIFRELRTASDPAVLASCGRMLLEFEQYEAARQFLEPALATSPSLSGAHLDLAIASFHLQSPEVALEELDKTPSADRKGDYYLLRAQILDSQGKVEEASKALNLGIRAAPTKASLYLQATGFLLKHKLYHEAQELLEQASRILPDDRELLLAQAVTLELLFRNIDAEKLLTRIQARWPEWDRPYLLGGILLEIQLKSVEARQMLETAIALGANTPEAYYYQALAIMHAAPNDLESAQNAIAHAMALTSKDPYVYLLAGKISLARNEYSAAITRLLEATHLQPTLIPAHYALRDAYKALGDEQKSNAELETIKHIAGENPSSDQSPFSMEDFLFTVRPPG
jgi:tetratricopeptide (TPR) repeat protein